MHVTIRVTLILTALALLSLVAFSTSSQELDLLNEVRAHGVLENAAVTKDGLRLSGRDVVRTADVQLPALAGHWALVTYRFHSDASQFGPLNVKLFDGAQRPAPDAQARAEASAPLVIPDRAQSLVLRASSDDKWLRLQQSGGEPLVLTELTLTLWSWPAAWALVLTVALLGIWLVFALVRSHLPAVASAPWATELSVAVFLALVVTLSGFHVAGLGQPFVFADEGSYAFRSKFGWEAFSNILIPVLPNHLFLAVYSWVHRFGDQALTVARLFNAFVYGAGALPIFRICRRYAERRGAALVTLVLCIAPSASYAAYFMPECLYFTLFWVFVLCVLRALEEPTARRVFVVALSLALLSLVKPHALILVGVVVLAIPTVVILWRDFKGVVLSLVASAAFAACWYGLWCLMCWRLSGTLQLDPVGSFYGSYAKTAVGQAVPPEVWGVLGRHLSVVGLLFAVPLSISTVGVVTRLWKREPDARPDVLVPFTVVGLGIVLALVLLSAKFTVTAVGTGPVETLARMHGRYYAFALPLLAILGLAWSREQLSLRSRWVIGAVIVTVVSASYVGTRSVFWQSYIDFPDAFALLSSVGATGLWILGSGFSVVMLARSTRTAVICFLAALAIFNPLAYVNASLAQHREPPVEADFAGNFLRAAIPPGERDQLVILSHATASTTYRLFFYALAAAPVVFLPLAPGTDLCGQIPDRVRFAVSATPEILTCGFESWARFGSASVWRREAATRGTSVVSRFEIHFNKDEMPPNEVTTGFHSAEPWGMWSYLPQTSVTLPHPVEGCVDLTLRLRALGQAVGRRLTLHLGAESADITLPDQPALRTARFTLAHRADLLMMTGVEAKSPKDQGMGDDIRPLGYGLEMLAAAPCSSSPLP